jgi:hypothetical protein
MTRHTCADCGQSIPNGQAHIRSSCFAQVALCGECLVRKKRKGKRKTSDSADRPR